VASGEIDYLVWEPNSTTAVCQFGQLGLIRYQSRLDIDAGGHKAPLRRYWRTDSCEQRNGRWQVVWSQATEAQARAVTGEAALPW
jgi:hypothetical protein